MTTHEIDIIKQAATRLRQSGKTTLANGLDRILAEQAERNKYTASAVFGGEQATEAVAPTIVAADDLSEVAEYVSQSGEFDLLSKIISGAKLNALLTGPTGCGKTHLVRAVAKSLGKEMFTVQGGGGATYERIVAKDSLAVRDGATFLQTLERVLPVAMRRGAILYLDEPNSIPNEVLFYLFGAMDDRRQISFEDGSSLKATKGFTVVCAMNEGAGYAGTSILNNAFRSRGDAIVEVKYLPARREATLLKNRCGIDAKVATRLAKLGETIRVHFTQKTVRTPIGTRDLMACAIMLKDGIELMTALHCAIVNKVPSQFPNERKAITDCIAAIFSAEETGD